jgi:hypothetical protein
VCILVMVLLPALLLSFPTALLQLSVSLIVHGRLLEGVIHHAAVGHLRVLLVRRRGRGRGEGLDHHWCRCSIVLHKFGWGSMLLHSARRKAIEVIRQVLAIHMHGEHWAEQGYVALAWLVLEHPHSEGPQHQGEAWVQQMPPIA